jgi:hypothetical protein
LYEITHAKVSPERQVARDAYDASLQAVGELQCAVVQLRAEVAECLQPEDLHSGDGKVHGRLFEAFNQSAGVVGEEMAKADGELRADIAELRSRLDAISKPRNAA